MRSTVVSGFTLTGRHVLIRTAVACNTSWMMCYVLTYGNCSKHPLCTFAEFNQRFVLDVKLPPPPVFTTTPTTTTTTKKPPRPPGPPGPCRADQATCQSGECIPRDYICDGERDCSDGSDEFRCGKYCSLCMCKCSDNNVHSNHLLSSLRYSISL